MEDSTTRPILSMLLTYITSGPPVVQAFECLNEHQGPVI